MRSWRPRLPKASTAAAAWSGFPRRNEQGARPAQGSRRPPPAPALIQKKRWTPEWGATKIHGELLKLGIAVAQSTVSVYMVPRRGRPLQTWKTFLRNHMEGIASIDLFVVPTIAFQQLLAFLVLRHKRLQLLWLSGTRNPTAGG